MNIKKWVWLLLLPILMILGGKMGAETVQAQTLSNAITEVKLWDSANLREATLVNGVYQLNEGGKYSYFINFDLSHYGSNLQDGDVFTFTVPEGTTIGNGTTFPLTDKDTQVQLAVLSMTSNGAGKGGLVTVRLQNLADFYAKTVATGVKGSFFFDFEAATVGTNMSWPYESSELVNPLTHLVTVKAKLPPGTINTAGENFAKIGGAILNKPYNSAILGKQGNYIHSWTVRINTQQKSYTSPIIITDVIPDSSAPMQFIPETFILRSGSFTNSLSSISNAKILKLGTDYTVTFNATYTEFTLTIPNPGNSAFMLSYSTTSPEDGSIVANTVKMEVDGQLLPQNEIRPHTLEHYVERSSQITSGGIITADISRSLVLYKQDSVTGQLLPGAIFKVTAPSGEEFILNPTDAKGRTATKVFTKDEIVGEFTVTEIAAPLGYFIDPTPFKVTIDADGTVKTVKNTKDPNAKTSLQITKNWDDANNQDGKRPASITVDIFANGTQLTDKTLTMTGSATDATWTGQVTELPVFDAAGQLITYTISEAQVSGYEAPVIDQDTRAITNKYTPELINFSVTKTWNDANNQDGKRPLSVNFTLYKEVNGQKTQVDQRSLTVAGNWTTQFTGLAKYEAGQEIVYSVEEEVPALYAAEVTKDTAGNFTITNSYTPQTTTVPVTKVWDDASNQDGKRPASITVQLYKSVAGGAESPVTGKTLTLTAADQQDANTWSASFTGLPQFEQGQEITYSVKEEKVNGYKTTINGFTITNSYTPQTTTVPVTKVWDDASNQDGKRPASITVHLQKSLDGQTPATVASATITEADNWKTTFSNLPAYEAGKKITYTVTEDEVAEYTTTISGDAASGFTFTNSYTPQTTTVPVTKIWDDASNQDGKRPASITVQLYKSVAGGAESPITGKTLTLTAADQLDANTWSASFTGLPQFEQGQEITYSVKEEKVNGYKTTINGFTITNSYTPQTTTVPVTKVWDDANDQDGKRPASITVQLYKSVAGGAESPVTGKTLTLTAADQLDANTWSASFTDLPQFEQGQEITYSVKEEKVNGYKTTINGFTITNSYTPQTTTVPVTKVWDDSSNQDGKRPASITVHLQKSLEGQTPTTVASAIITEADNWTTTFSNLPAYEAGKKITYTVTEDEVAEYTTTISGDAANGFTITNTHPTETTTVPVTKVWDDASNQDGKRPASITVHLQKSLEGQTPATVASATITEADNWKTTFSNLPAYEAGKKITYTVTEDEVAEYTTTISGDAASGFTITNLYLPAVTEISGTKTWNDADNQDGKRPDSITVNLLANGQVVDSRQVSEATGWAYDFGKLATYKNGQLISYTIAEEEVPGYSASQDGYNLTNTYTPEKATITVNKTWEDADNQDGKRPSQITIHLMKTVNATKSIVATKTITAADNWTAAFAELPVYEAGQKIVYSVEEETVADYRTEIKDFTIINSYTPQTMDYQVTKVWDDANNQDGLRPESITVQLYKSVAGGAETPVTGKTLILTAANQLDANTWSASFTGLPQFEQGQEIVYSVKEDEATLAVLAEKGYQSAVTGTVVTNSRTPEQIKISGKKVWDDADNQDGIRPEAITVQIMNGTLLVDEIQVTAANDWAFQSKDLPKYANGQEIAYTVVEVGPASYQASQQQEADGSYTLTNSYEPSKTSLLGTAIWSDVNNYDGIRPDSIVVRLLSNGRELKALTISAETGWQYAFTDLPKYANGQEIVYSISSDPVAGYDLRIDGTQITNTHIPQVVPTEPPAPAEPPVPTEPPAPTGDLSSSVTVTPTTGKQTILPRTGQADGLWLTLSGITLALVTGFVLKPKKLN